MGGFLYFVPDHVTRATELTAWGLDYVFDREAVGFSACGCTGPGAIQGTIVADDRDGVRVGYYPKEQDWRRIAAPGVHVGQTKSEISYLRSGVWLGVETKNPPGPNDLIRRDALAGYGVRLLDGREWTVPVARGLNEEDGELRYRMCLPSRMTLDDTGRWVGGEVTSRWKELWEVAERFWSAFVGGAVENDEKGLKVSLNFADIAEAAVTALGGNYRVRRDEVAMLGLLDQANSLEICKALVDWRTMEAWLKKKVRESETTTAGS